MLRGSENFMTTTDLADLRQIKRDLLALLLAIENDNGLGLEPPSYAKNDNGWLITVGTVRRAAALRRKWFGK